MYYWITTDDGGIRSEELYGNDHSRVFATRQEAVDAANAATADLAAADNDGSYKGIEFEVDSSGDLPEWAPPHPFASYLERVARGRIAAEYDAIVAAILDHATVVRTEGEYGLFRAEVNPPAAGYAEMDHQCSWGETELQALLRLADRVNIRIDDAI